MKTSLILLWNLKGRDIWFWLMDIRLLVAPEHPLKHCQFNVIWRHKVFALDRRLCYEEVTGTAELGVSAPPPPHPHSLFARMRYVGRIREKKKENDEILKSCNLRQNLLETFRFDRKYFMESPQVWKFSEEEWPRVPLQIRTPGAQYQAPPPKKKRKKASLSPSTDTRLLCTFRLSDRFAFYQFHELLKCWNIPDSSQTQDRAEKALGNSTPIRQTSSLSL